MEAYKSRFCYWLVTIGILLFGYGQSNISEYKEIPRASRQTTPVTQSFQQSHSLKFTAEAASFDGIYISGRSAAAEDKSKPSVKYIVSHPGSDVYAQLASVYIHRFSSQAYFSNILYLLYCVLII
ncbi:hypothetical protein GXP67_12865 [Rhodocytophaga rosea]|uniref:Uncharacterized protein n=1 Tax=Rhodocytophaga rosea TaxID=2704465 RepID=A0A6C0GHT3_9BACT|nr:hypothetical protein [Rhodocytophaga rosea]QHT67455.1 hypothetical protein GXP67_12865 [Rhodocytophaga rosea]